VIHRGIDMSRFDPAAVEPLGVDAVAEQWRVPPGAKLVLVPRKVGGARVTGCFCRRSTGCGGAISCA